MKKLLRLFRRRRWPVVAYWKGGILRGKIKLPVRHEWCTQIGMRVTARTDGCVVEERTFDHTFAGFKFELDGEDCYAPMNVPKGWSIHPVQPRASASQDCEEEEEDEESLSRRIRGWVTRFVRASVDLLRSETERKLAEANRRFDERVAHMIAESKERFEQQIERVRAMMLGNRTGKTDAVRKQVEVFTFDEYQELRRIGVWDESWTIGLPDESSKFPPDLVAHNETSQTNATCCLTFTGTHEERRWSLWHRPRKTWNEVRAGLTRPQIDAIMELASKRAIHWGKGDDEATPVPGKVYALEGAPQTFFNHETDTIISGGCDHHWKQWHVQQTKHDSKFLMRCGACGGMEYVVLSDQQLAAGRSPEDALNDKYKRSGS